jgi:hypothetical protein
VIINELLQPLLSSATTTDEMLESLQERGFHEGVVVPRHVVEPRLSDDARGAGVSMRVVRQDKLIFSEGLTTILANKVVKLGVVCASVGCIVVPRLLSALEGRAGGVWGGERCAAGDTEGRTADDVGDVVIMLLLLLLLLEV